MKLTLAQLDSELHRRKYWLAPADWAEDCIAWRAGEGLRPYQAESLNDLVRHHRVAVRSLRGAGKTSDAAIGILWFCDTRSRLTDGSDWKVPTTAGVYRQLIKYLWPEIHKWVRRLRWGRLGRRPYIPNVELLAGSLKLGPDVGGPFTGEAFAMASDDPGLIEGAHADHMMFVFDEAKSISDALFDSAEGSFMGGKESFVLATSTPGEPAGRFYAIHARAQGFEDWHVRHITLAEAIAAKQVSPEFVERRKKQWGEKSALFQNQMLGEFAAQEETAVIPLAWVEAAVNRWHEWQDSLDTEDPVHLPGIGAVGTDVASSTAETVHALLAGLTCVELRVYEGSAQSTMTTAGQVAGILHANPEASAVLDVVGIGRGAYDRLVEQGYEVIPFSAGAKVPQDVRDATGELGFYNLRSQAWWHLRELLDPDNPLALDDPNEVRLPPDPLLLGDLTAPRWRINSAQKIEVEPKHVPITSSRSSDDSPGWWGSQGVAKRLGRSTDRGDAVVMAYAARFLGVNLQVPAAHREEYHSTRWIDNGYIPEEDIAEETFL